MEVAGIPKRSQRWQAARHFFQVVLASHFTLFHWPKASHVAKPRSSVGRYDPRAWIQGRELLWPFFQNLEYQYDLFIYFAFRATPSTYGSSLARSRNGAAAASLHHSHNNARSEPCLRPSPQQRQILNQLSEARDRTCIFMDTSWVLFCWATTGTP